MMLSVFVSELRLEFLLWRAYRLNAISSVLMWGVIFPIILVGLQKVAIDHGVAFGDTAMSASVIGFLVWRLCMSVLAAMPQMIEQEARVGVVENIVLATSTPVAMLLIFRAIARSLRSLLETTLLGVILIVLFKVPLPLSPTAVFVILLTLAGTLGVGFVLSGAALVYKSVSSFTGIVTILALFISGAAVPLNALGIIFTVLKLGFPTTWGIDILRGVILSGDNLSTLITNGSLFGLLIQSAILVSVGLWLFNLAFNHAKRTGQLGSY
jgi:ABC-2 type transport system permease protein